MSETGGFSPCPNYVLEEMPVQLIGCHVTLSSWIRFQASLLRVDGDEFAFHQMHQRPTIPWQQCYGIAEAIERVAPQRVGVVTKALRTHYFRKIDVTIP